MSKLLEEVLYCLCIVIMYHLFGFEFSVICLLSAILYFNQYCIVMKKIEKVEKKEE